jgi:hypothetical protein
VTASIINTTTLGKVALYSLVSGIGIAVIFGLGVSSVAGLLEALRQHRSVAGVAWAVLAITCIVCALGAVVFGVVVMSEKG